MIPKSISRILCPVDFSKYSDYIVDYAKFLSEFKSGKVYILHIIEDPLDMIYRIQDQDIDKSEVYKIAEKKAHELIFQLVDRVKILPDYTVPIVKLGDPCSQIIEFTEKENIDLVVMSTHGRTGIQRILVGSVAEEIIRNAKCPVVVFNRNVKTSTQ